MVSSPLHDRKDRLTALAWLALAVGLLPSAAAAQPSFVCETPYGWCELGATGQDESVCWCDAAGEQVAGGVTFAERPNPFTRMMPGTDVGATRSLGGAVTASRGFAGPSQMPPRDFAAYGILAFKRRASDYVRDRHLLICEAYLNSLPAASELGLPLSEQMVTIWPIETDDLAERISAADRSQACEQAVDRYGLVQAQNALRILGEYEGVAVDLSARGPFLIAWTPTDKILEQGSAAMVVDLSDVDAYESAVAVMDRWRERIQNNPEMWRSGLEPESRWTLMVTAIRDFFDENGEIIRYE